MRFESLAAWLAWLEQCHPREIDLGLERIRQVAERMGLLNTTAKVVIVGGTNGKGSCVTATAALLRVAGYSVGVYTSPHLLDYNERIVIDGAQAGDSEICIAFEKIYRACQPLTAQQDPISLTYFEYGTLAALEIFRQHQVTAMVLEVGLGGKLDAVNILDADVSVVTSIDIDHQEWLGDNREDIGFEKAGIYRAGRSAICADAQPPARLLNYAGDLGADLLLKGRDFDFSFEGEAEWSWWGSGGQFNSQPRPQLPLPSMAAALEAVSQLGVAISSASFELLAQLRVPGRFQQITWQARRLYLDVAHNPAATGFLAKGLESVRARDPSVRVFGIVAMMSDKDRKSSLANLLGLVDCWLTAQLDDVPRAATPEQLGKNLSDLDQQVAFAGHLDKCLAYALEHSAPADIILIFGSFFTVAAGLAALKLPVSPWQPSEV